MKYLITILLLFLFLEAFSQEKFISIEGTIRGPEGNAVEYATVRVKHDRNTTSAFSDGRFKLNGVKIGDTLIFTNVGYRQSYFVINKKYNKLDFTLTIDTLNTSIRRPFNNIIFNFTSTYSGGSKFFPVKFSETSELVLDENRPDDKKMFTKVEVDPVFYISNQVFVAGLDSTINKLPKKYMPQKSGLINVFYWIRKNKKIEVTTVESSFREEVNNIFFSFFDKTYNIFPAIQNGRKIDIFCITKFNVEINEDKSVSVKIFQ